MGEEPRKPMLFVRFGDHQADPGRKGGCRIDDSKPDYVTTFSVTDNRPGAKHFAVIQTRQASVFPAPSLSLRR